MSEWTENIPDKLKGYVLALFLALFSSGTGFLISQSLEEQNWQESIIYVIRHGGDLAIFSSVVAVGIAAILEGVGSTVVIAWEKYKKRQEKAREEGADEEREQWMKWREEQDIKSLPPHLNGEEESPPTK